MRKLQGHQPPSMKKDYLRGAGLRHRYSGAVAVMLLCGERSDHTATYLQIISGIQFMVLRRAISINTDSMSTMLYPYLMRVPAVFTLRFGNLTGHFIT
ncbi:hypothetical protein O3S68_21900 [Kosakonia sp. SOY2]|uniref:hypothetical protein n=1 Tax=Kosakonia sp. SOY2 TaxID=3014557 RepID=UPI0022AC5F02|nr:hypothetical protein [Kosakonia sp. SOY2]MCZ3384936.1 hypothetical protein [Kosakonia sp. SOY2]